MRTLILSLVILISCQILVAQNKFGIQGGSLISTIGELDRRGGNSDIVKPKASYYFGLLREYQFNHKYAIEANLVYLRKGFRVTMPEEKLTFHYLDLQLCSQLNFQNRGSLLLGMGYGRLLSVTREAIARNTIYWDKEVSLYFLLGYEYQFIDEVAFQTRLGYDFLEEGSTHITLQMGLNFFLWK